MHRFLPALLALTLVGCATAPRFAYSSAPGAELDTSKTIAFDPRDLVWITEGQRPFRADSLKRLAMESLEAKGFRQADPKAADLWLNVYATRPASSDGSNEGGPDQGSGPGGGMPGMRGGGGMGGGPMGGGGGMEGGMGGSPMGGGGSMGGGRSRGEMPSGRGSSKPTGDRPFPPGGPMMDEIESSELTLTVQLLSRKDEQPVWTGSVYVPRPGKKERPGPGRMKEIVERLLERLGPGYSAQGR